MDTTIAKTIIEQLGGSRFAVMTGAKRFTALENGVQFSISHAKDGINKVKVVLDPSDTYTVEFWHIWGGKASKVCEVSDVYCDMLQDIFKEKTGLYTHF